ncbi:MAG: hypothetical protein KKG25_16355 [Bacteroidetes bacterium]|nr:hypothetical protein [Bacteroidota bacterium]MBU1486421.1 hypothetical protein [Bacteroidota bacterium]
MSIRERVQPRYVKAGSSNVVLATGRCLIAASLSTEGVAASAVFYDALNVTHGGCTVDRRLKLAVGPQTGTVSDGLKWMLQFNTGCVVSCHGSALKTALNIGFVDLSSEGSH